MDSMNMVDEVSQPSLAVNSCVSCKQGKRKCNRARPICSTCERVGRKCTYEEDSLTFPSSSGIRSLTFDVPSEATKLLPARLSDASYIFPARGHIDPFLHDSLRGPTVDVMISEEASRILGSVHDVHLLATSFFETVWKRLPIICQFGFFKRLPGLYIKPNADLLMLCTAFHLVMQRPSESSRSMQSSLYVTVKSCMSLLESAGILTLESIQARVFICLYEMGHGIHPAASISIGACARSARAMGLHEKSFQYPQQTLQKRARAESEKRTWWAIIILDRYINLCDQDALFATEDPKPSDHLPIDDKKWAQNILPDENPMTLATPNDFRVGPFARECQIIHLAGRVLRHVVHPTSDLAFQREEALQLERTFVAFLPLLMEEQELEFGLFCPALAISRSALFTLYDSALGADPPPSDENRRTIIQSIEASSLRTAHFTHGLYGDANIMPVEDMSPFQAYSQYQAGVVFLRLWKETGEAVYKDMLNNYKTLMKAFARRWIAARKYLDLLEEQQSNWCFDTARPATFFPKAKRSKVL
ncbi:hypothetical protein B0J14DRAFT_257906 [Halenospora varia]|nr:hypothetical protein B0J14DRAFT_257906 [Halenospora varia]